MGQRDHTCPRQQGPHYLGESSPGQTLVSQGEGLGARTQQEAPLDLRVKRSLTYGGELVNELQQRQRVGSGGDSSTSDPPQLFCTV